MASPTSLRNAVSKVIKLVGPMARTTYIRTTVLSGTYDELIGRGGTGPTFYDALPSPQPVFHQLGKRQAMYLSTPNLQLVGDDYKFIWPTTGVDVANFEDPRVSLLLVDANGTEFFRILYIDPAQYAGADVAVFVYARSLGHKQVNDISIGVAPPTFSLAGGSYVGAQTVSISAVVSSPIYYTLDGSTPTVNSTVYSDPIVVSVSETIKALTVANGISSTVSSASYIIS